MRINKYIASATGLSRRAADSLLLQKGITVNGLAPTPGQDITEHDIVMLNGKQLTPNQTVQTIIFNKPVGFVCSRNGQGSKTIYDLLPKSLHHLKPVGRLDKDSSGLLLLTTDGDLANRLTHPKYEKQKVYVVTLNVPLTTENVKKLQSGIKLEDGPSKLQLHAQDATMKHWRVTMHEGRNRQIRRTFAAVQTTVVTLHRITFGSYELGNLASGTFKKVD
jgi:23S rRNA pseudouridine2605 synthase